MKAFSAQKSEFYWVWSQRPLCWPLTGLPHLENGIIRFQSRDPRNPLCRPIQGTYLALRAGLQEANRFRSKTYKLCPSNVTYNMAMLASHLLKPQRSSQLFIYRTMKSFLRIPKSSDEFSTLKLVSTDRGYETCGKK